jgi:hypothetical protein
VIGLEACLAHPLRRGGIFDTLLNVEQQKGLALRQALFLDTAVWL